MGARKAPLCEGCSKRAYPKRSKALAVMAGMLKRGVDRMKPGILHVYECPFGNGYHIGQTWPAR